MKLVIAFLMVALLMSWSTYALGDYAYSAVSLGLALMLVLTSAGILRERKRSKIF
jgi:hypothetical protein